jgi:UDP:flavonoid glycosyltransferase YjiC (YdhE family)
MSPIVPHACAQIIWKLNMDVGELPANIKAMSWIPQNDLLAHPNIRAFISHGGTVHHMMMCLRLPTW